MKYWICILDRRNFDIVIQKKIWGVSERHKNTISKVEIDDRLVFYITKESVFGGISEVASDNFIDEESVFLPPYGDWNQTFPLRIIIKPVTIFKEPMKIKPLIPKLDIIKNKNNWAGHFMGKAMVQIEKHDIDLIINNHKKILINKG